MESISAALRENVATLVAILAAIPIGFLVYQTYYLFYRPKVFLWPLPWHGRWVRLDRGSQVLSNFEDGQIEVLRELFGAPLDVSKPYSRDRAWLVRRVGMLKLDAGYISRFESRRAAQDAYRDRWYDNWDVLRAVVDISEAREATRGIKREYVNLSDLYHALGATRTALMGGWLFALAGCGAAAIHRHERALDWLIGAACFSVASACAVGVIHQTRRQTWTSAWKSLLYGLRWVFDHHPDLFEFDDGTASVSPTQDAAPQGRVYGIRRRIAEAVSPDLPPT